MSLKIVPPKKLTKRQEEVLELVAQGFSNKVIAAKLGISEHTVAQHVKVIYATLGIHSRAEAATHYRQMASEPNRQPAFHHKGATAYRLLSIIIDEEKPDP